MSPVPPAAPPAAPSDDTLEQWLRASRQLEDAPEALIQRVIARGPAAAATPADAAAGAVSRVRRWLASLVHDLAPQPAMALGLRSGGLTARRVLCRAEHCDIDLQISPGPPGRPGWLLHGQVLGDLPHCAGGQAPRVRLLGAGAAAAPDMPEQPLDDMAEFRFGPLPDGSWTLQLNGGDWLIELPPLTLSAGHGSPPTP